MSEKERYTFHQNGNYHTVIDEKENVPLIMIEFKEDEFPVYACFHKIIDLLNEQEKEIQRLKCINRQLEERLDRSIALDMSRCGKYIYGIHGGSNDCK